MLPWSWGGPLVAPDSSEQMPWFKDIFQNFSDSYVVNFVSYLVVVVTSLRKLWGEIGHHRFSKLGVLCSTSFPSKVLLRKETPIHKCFHCLLAKDELLEEVVVRFIQLDGSKLLH